MRGIRVRELLLIVAVVALGLGWARQAVESGRRVAAVSAESQMRLMELDARVMLAKARADDLARRLAECEAEGRGDE